MKLLLVALLVAATPAFAGKIEFVKKVAYTNDFGEVKLHDVGDPRYLAVTNLSFATDAGGLDVLDLEAGTALRVSVTRRALEKALLTTGLSGELVTYTPAAAGLHVAEGALARGKQHWYVELDLWTQKISRAVSLGKFGDDTEVYFGGTDPTRNVAWFCVAKFGEGLKGFTHQRGPTSMVFRSLDLATLKTTDVVTIALPGRPMKSGYEDQLMVHHANDFSWFAIVEYDEEAFHSQPAGKVYFVDPRSATSFAVPALDTNYGVAFSADGLYAYLASSQRGQIARVDMQKQKIDKTLRGPTLTHDLAISPDGSKLFVIGSSKQYNEISLVKFGSRTAKSHAPEVASGTEQLFGNGRVSGDGKYYVLRSAMIVHKDKTVEEPRELIVAKFVD